VHVLISADVARRLMLIAKTGQKAVCCQNLTLGALSSRSALSLLFGALFKKVRSLFEHASYSDIYPLDIREGKQLKRNSMWLAWLQASAAK